MSIKQYTAEELLAELANRVKPPVCVVEVTDAVAELRAQVERLRFEVLGIEEQKRQAEMERDALQARVTELEKDLAAWRDAAIAESRGRDVSDVDWVLRAHAAEDKLQALQARIDAGVRVWGDKCAWGDLDEYDTHTGIVIDVEEIKPDVREMVDDDRKGKADRREAYSTGPVCRVNQTTDTIGRLRTPAPNRRKTPGTKADRVKEHAVFVESGLDATSGPVYYQEQWTRADGSTNPRKGERRKGLEERCTDACRRAQCRESVGPCYTQSDADDYHDNRRDPSGANDRRKAAK